MDLGAPVDKDGNPRLIGDQTLWAIFSSRTTLEDEHPLYGYLEPMGIEVSLTVYGFNQEPVQDVVFLHYRVTNYNTLPLDSLLISYFVDFDIGEAVDDQGGTDSTLHMVFGYNQGEEDSRFPSPVPAAGIMALNQPSYSSFIRLYVANPTHIITYHLILSKSGT